MSNPQAESVIRNIIQEICIQCSTHGQTVSETLAAFIVRNKTLAYNIIMRSQFQVKAAVLDPQNDFSVDRTLTKDDVEKLIQVINETEHEILTINRIAWQDFWTKTHHR